MLKSALMALEARCGKKEKEKNPKAKLSDTLGLWLSERKVTAAFFKMLTVIFLRQEQ